ncbi:NUDIX hydrolase [Ferviditalea candida]|uniref:CoA pyrophosphatase n=1 Tax=Ferviditalea candida TaxID=3108399 RepID=A0ABU5ZED5_9BACL|nr:CoA pyrophosphatase [Paenibacillaceae bacterium T2]
MKKQQNTPTAGEHERKEPTDVPKADLAAEEHKSEKLVDAWGMSEVIEKVQSHTRGMLDEHLYRKSSVLVPLLLNEKGKLSVLFEKRAHKVKQPGDICFPGGRIEAGDNSAWETAVRETSEELRIQREDVQWIGDLDYLVHHDRSIIYPYVGLIHGQDKFEPNPDEVAEVFCIELEELLQARVEHYQLTFRPEPDVNFPYHLIHNGVNYSWRMSASQTPFYRIGERVIWGMTARILKHFIEVVNKASMS